MEKIIEKTHCTGCAACANICSHGAIDIKQDERGFHRPIINKEKCVNCGLCKKVCPILNYKETNKKNPNVYAIWANDEIREVSSSGGLFTLLAQYVIDNNGVVVGAAFNNNWEVEHIIIDNEKDLNKLRGSKYVQSRISEHLYKDIKTILKNDRYVLFSGCPCQVAGLKYYLQKDYEKLILVDLICSGTPSPKAFKKYLTEISDNSNILKINFRDKRKYGWTCSHSTITTEEQEITDFKFMHSFLSKSISNESCSECKFATLPRQSDITIGDFWGIEKYKKSWNDKKGTSMFIANNKKGEKIMHDKALKVYHYLNTDVRGLSSIQNNYAEANFWTYLKFAAGHKLDKTQFTKHYISDMKSGYAMTEFIDDTIPKTKSPIDLNNVIRLLYMDFSNEAVNGKLYDGGGFVKRFDFIRDKLVLRYFKKLWFRNSEKELNKVIKDFEQKFSNPKTPHRDKIQRSLELFKKKQDLVY